MGKLEEIYEALREFAEWLAKQKVNDVTVFKDKHELKITRVGSRHGTYMRATIDGNFVISELNECNRSGYIHGDFNAPYTNITRDQAIWLVKNKDKILTEIENIKKRIEEETKEL